MTGAVDLAFAHAVRAAATGDGSALDHLLRSRAALGPAERELLVQLDAGAIRPVSGRGAALTQAERRYFAARYIAGGANESAMTDVVAETGMDRTTILGWVRSLRRGLERAPDRESVLRQILDIEGEHTAAIRRQADAERNAIHAQHEQDWTAQGE